MDTYKKKLENFMLNELALIDKPIILEFGVRKGTSKMVFYIQLISMIIQIFLKVINGNFFNAEMIILNF